MADNPDLNAELVPHPGELSQPDEAANDPLTKTLALVAILVVLFVMALLSLGLWIQIANYRMAVESAIGKSSIQAVFLFSRSLDAALIRTSSLLLAFLLVFLGALYTLRSAGVAFRLGVKTPYAGGTLTTTAPGLVLVALGATLAALAMFARSEINLSADSIPASSPVAMKPLNPPNTSGGK